MRVINLLCALLLAGSSIGAQPTQPCAVSVEYETTDLTDPIVFNARVKSNQSLINQLKYKWRVTAGTITAGQNTSSITMDTAGLAGQTVTATVEISSLADSCSSSQTVRIIHEPMPPTVFDRYGDLKFEDEKIRLDNYAKFLSDTPEMRGAILVHAGKRTYHGEASDRLRRAKHYLVNFKAIHPDRIITIDSGFDDKLTVNLWIVPPDATPPWPESRVPIQEVRFNKPRPKASTKQNKN